MGIKDVINSHRGKLLVAFLIGFGLSTFFRKECKDDACMEFKAPSMDKINGQMFEYNSKCYKFESKAVDCSNTKKIVQFEK